MIKIKINNKTVEIPQGSTILEAAENENIKIPTMCHVKGLPHITSCMICLVEDTKSGKLLPACSTPVSQDMEIETETQTVIDSRKDALELMLSEHVGDCEAPCRKLCPAHMNIPEMLRLIAANKMDEALVEVKKDIALPSVLGYTCPAPCEKGCRRGQIDEPVSICLLKRYVGEEDLNNAKYLPKKAKSTGKKVAVIGAGATGLAAAYYLTLKGHQCEIFDSKEQAGGLIRYGQLDVELPIIVLDEEIKTIEQLGVKFHLNQEVDSKAFSNIQKKHDAVVLAVGEIKDKPDFGLKTGKNGIETDSQNYTTSIKGVFAGGDAIRKGKMAVRAVGHGKEIAFSVNQYLLGEEIIGEKLPFNSRFGKLAELEYSEYLKEANDGERIKPVEGIQKGFSQKEAIQEASRCLHCDCRKPNDCKLRIYADQYRANQKTYHPGNRNNITKEFFEGTLVYESEKCIKCGICVEITRTKKEEYGLTFIGRGFDVKVDVPFNKSISEGLKKNAKECAEKCPTGALSLLS